MGDGGVAADVNGLAEGDVNGIVAAGKGTVDGAESTAGAVGDGGVGGDGGDLGGDRLATLALTLAFSTAYNISPSDSSGAVPPAATLASSSPSAAAAYAAAAA